MGEGYCCRCVGIRNWMVAGLVQFAAAFRDGMTNNHAKFHGYVNSTQGRSVLEWAEACVNSLMSFG